MENPSLGNINQAEVKTKQTKQFKTMKHYVSDLYGKTHEVEGRYRKEYTHVRPLHDPNNYEILQQEMENADDARFDCFEYLRFRHFSPTPIYTPDPLEQWGVDEENNNKTNQNNEKGKKKL